MTREVYADKKFIEFSKSQVFMRVMLDTDAEGKQLADKFQIDATPTIIVLDSKGKEVDRIIGGRPAQAYIDDLEEIFQSAKSVKYTI
jgi:thiol-disulfide isomerase/thioredoxin